jgi:hypothetical protein
MTIANVAYNDTFKIWVDATNSIIDNINSFTVGGVWDPLVVIDAANESSTVVGITNGDGIYPLPTTGGSGTGLIVDVEILSGQFKTPLDFTINSPGSGYNEGDLITVDTSSLTGTISGVATFTTVTDAQFPFTQILSDVNGLLDERWLPKQYISAGGDFDDVINYTTTGLPPFNSPLPEVLSVDGNRAIVLDSQGFPNYVSEGSVSLCSNGAFDELDGNIAAGNLYVMSGGILEIATNLSAGYENRKSITMDLAGAVILPDTLTVANQLSCQANLSVTGDVGIGGSLNTDNIDVVNTLNVTGDITATTITADTITESSDVILKENIAPLSGAGDMVSKLRGVKYNRKGSEREEIGVLAQEVEEIAPELVHTDSDGLKSVNYGRLSAILIDAVKELQEEIRQLKSK